MNPQEENKKPVAPMQIPEIPKKSSANDLFIRPLRTYEDDVKNAVQKDSVSTVKILMAEQQKRQTEQGDLEQNSPTSKTNIVKILLAVFFLVLGIGAIGGGYYYYTRTQTFKPEQVTILTSNNFIDAESVININQTEKTNRDVVGEIRNIIKVSDDTKQDTLKEIELLKTVVKTENGKEFSNDIELTTEEFFNILEAREPDALTRSLDSKFLLGVHKTKDSVEPFIIFRTNDYEISYTKMLDWERLLIPDIQDVFFENLGSSQAFIEYEINFNEERGIQNPLPETIVSSEVASTTTTESATSTTTGTSAQTGGVTNTNKYEARDFKDLILSNKDTRSISDSGGKLLFFYSFIDRKYIILTTNSDTLGLIINRLNSAQLVR
jgi:hypothetical protein